MKKQQIIRCNHGHLQWGGGMPAGRNIPLIQTFSQIKQERHWSLWRDGLAIFKNISGPKSEKVGYPKIV